MARRLPLPQVDQVPQDPRWENVIKDEEVTQSDEAASSHSAGVNDDLFISKQVGKSDVVFSKEQGGKSDDLISNDHAGKSPDVSSKDHAVKSDEGIEVASGSSPDEAIDVDALINEPVAADEHVPYFVYPKDEDQNANQEAQQDVLAAPVTDEECFDVAHAATLAYVESKLSKVDVYTRGILKQRKAFRTLYLRHADLRVWHIKRCAEYDAVMAAVKAQKGRPLLHAKDWHAPGLYKKLIQFHKNRVPTECLPEGEDATYGGQGLDDAARTQAHLNVMSKYPDRRLYDAMLQAKRIENLVGWRHSSSDAFMTEFKAEFGHTFGFETGKEVTAAFMSAGEAVENTWDRNFRGDPTYNGFLDVLLGEPTPGVLGLNGNDCLEVSSARAITGRIAAAARRKAAAAANQPLLTAFAKQQLRQGNAQQAPAGASTPATSLAAAQQPLATAQALAAAQPLVNAPPLLHHQQQQRAAASSSASSNSTSASSPSAPLPAPAAAATGQSQPSRLLTDAQSPAAATVKGGLREMSRTSQSLGSKAAALALANGGLPTSLEHSKPKDKEAHRRCYEVSMPYQLLGERARIPLNKAQLDALSITDDSYLTSTRARVRLEARQQDGKPLVFIGTVADLQFMTKWRLIVTYRRRNIELDWRSGSCLPELFALLGKHLGIAPLIDLLVPPRQSTLRVSRPCLLVGREASIARPWRPCSSHCAAGFTRATAASTTRRLQRCSTAIAASSLCHKSQRLPPCSTSSLATRQSRTSATTSTCFEVGGGAYVVAKVQRQPQRGLL